jgi:hypothetical protein
VTDAPFTVADFDHLSRLVLDAWGSAVDRDWSVPAGTLEWSCFTTADHTVDCVFSYALFLGSRRQDDYPNFGELHALPGSTPRDLVDGLRAVSAMLVGVITIAEPDARAIIWRRPAPTTASPPEFAARGGHELILHAYDVCTGLGVPFDPPRDLCQRLFDASSSWTVWTEPFRPTGDPWSDLLERSGRPRAE